MTKNVTAIGNCLPVLGLVLLLTLTGCSDAATRVAEDIEESAKKLDQPGASEYTITHVPKSWPEGCDGDYTLQLSQASSLLVWCKDASKKATSSHTTTYHLNFVDVPETFIVDKHAGEPAYIRIEKRNGKATVVGVR